MKKLRATSSEREEFLKAIRDELYMGNYGKVIEDFSIEDIKKEFSKVPENINKPILNVTAETYVKMLELVNQATGECSWHGLVDRQEYNNTTEYTIYDILVFPQINSGIATTTDEDEFAEWQTKLIMDPDFPIENLRMHGHSHVNMNVFSSGVDDKYQEDLLAKVDDEDYYIFLIMNKKMEICMFIYDFTQQVMFDTDDIDFRIINSETGEDLRTWAIDELEQNERTSKVANKSNNVISQIMFDEEDYSFFGNAKPIFKGMKR